MTSFKKLSVLWLPLILYMSLMWHLSSRPIEVPSLDIPFLDKFLHLIEYAIFGFLLARAVSFDAKPDRKIAFSILIIFLAVAWGALDEYHQSFVETRDANVWDFVFDCCGAGLGNFLFISLLPNGNRLEFGNKLFIK